MKKRIKAILLVVTALILVGAAYGYYQFSRGNRDLATAAAEITIAAPTLVTEYSTDEALANKKYLNKIIGVRGKCKTVETDSIGTVTIYLDTDDPISGISCQLDKQHNDQAKTVKGGDSVSVIGVCTGFLSDVVLVRCSIQNARL